ncbi:nucleotide exchange factor GrpE [Paenarthrobacter aurescens]|uniref:Protein GrpE n=1 Tax=Paenarthrobacter aurescens TaxID=43663 RepID=A0A4Y3NAC5_PAEAU|nr:nucleotide exchange factor GrpE [Paenarthrobacter aurescens]UKA49375.1 nucleotide exchange factor GrpE [Arthrobacter sp. FW305-123]MDO6145003.1 nucleotide exchange factor GrpE [Paenarthrobacter aurescens]MDO6148848.1 nucleotide exchange factor GrpE [Paenarthrobacter aurescens]MDO6160094.1 nucleotide exchange factor GrpE [Paenarthrobacter aurescens]MDO6163953.1 nucleotide exchange factor GrpE [Paenarthrobacter aurescens]
MPHHGNEAEHSEGNEPRKPVIRDNRKVDPETGAARHPDNEAAAPTEGNAAPTDGDALSQAEEILNGVEVPAEESVASGAAAEAQAAELRNDLLRLQAEYVNYRKRVERDRAVAGEMAVIGVLNSLLPVLDDVDAARQHGDLEDGPFAAIATKLENALKTYGLERIADTGVEFDPTIHEALIQQPGEDIEVDTVSQVLRSGYRSGERVLRAAQVIVAVPA